MSKRILAIGLNQFCFNGVTPATNTTAALYLLATGEWDEVWISLKEVDNLDTWLIAKYIVNFRSRLMLPIILFHSGMTTKYEAYRMLLKQKEYDTKLVKVEALTKEASKV